MTHQTRTRRAALVAIVMLAVAVGTAFAAVGRITGPAGMPHEFAVRVDPPTPALVIGDSAISAIRWVVGADNAVIGFDHTLDLESCRRLYQLSCRGREGRVPATAYQAIVDHGRKYKILVVATGYNDSEYGFDTAFKNIVDRARSFGYTQVVWWTLRSDVDYVSPDSISNHETFARNNQRLRDLLATGLFPDVVVADWGRYTSTKHDWFVTDGVHYRAVGAFAASDYLSRKMAFLDRRACPVPRTPTSAPENPCPDPDLTGPVADIAALYQIGSDGVLCYEVGELHQTQCQQDSHVIQLTRALAPGMSGVDVSALQVRLIRLGMLTAAATGTFGPQTAEAVGAFQLSVSIPVTSIADRATLAALGFDVSAVP